MTNILFSFDTEDFTSNHAADAIRDVARLLQSEGIRGNFCLVGLLARHLVQWGRGDVLDALKYHEIQFHSYGHSLHPTINEYTDLESFDDAYGFFMAQEREGLQDVLHATGVEGVYAAVPPGNSQSYVAMYGYADMAIPAYCDTSVDTAGGDGVFFCNALHMDYVTALETFLFEESFDADELLDRLARRRTAIIFNHPNMILYREFWDQYNYYKQNLVPFGQWIDPPRRTDAQTERFYTRLKTLLSRLKSDGRFCFKTVSQMVAEREPGKPRIVTPDMISGIRDRLNRRFYPLESPLSLSLSDVFLAAVGFLRGEKTYRAGKVYGFLDRPAAVSSPCAVDAAAVRQAAMTMDVSRFLPPAVPVDGQVLGPADFLFAALDVLCGREGPVEITPRSQQMNLDEFPKLRDISFKGTWVHSDSFMDRHLSDRLRLQAWTLRK